MDGKTSEALPRVLLPCPKCHRRPIVERCRDSHGRPAWRYRCPRRFLPHGRGGADVDVHIAASLWNMAVGMYLDPDSCQ
ncbi:hypothetical protein BMOU_1050 [Bifidobacterium moukalabense DSM 27321]|uniref:Uncharacterized protein n=1 Tax=Bifidobacterium moukalabense DSM 27321 TaxID=1435051 RepID=W4N918_9BIFI|nr:hypothetical protein BMOU_1050 [Bifidobacterium moukalabense DSM 27321]